MLWHVPVQAEPSIQIQRMVRLGQYANASASIRTGLESNPQNADLHALAGTVFSRSGLYADALPAFLLAQESAFYESEGLYAHADALRETGSPEAAAELRSQRLLASGLDESRELIIGLGLVDDYIRAGDFDRADETLHYLHTLWPRSPALHGHMADYYLELGDLESADFHLWYVTEVLGLRLGMRGMFATYRIHLHHGDLSEAQRVLDEAMELHKKNLRLRARQAELYRLQGDSKNALEGLRAQRFWFQMHPEMRAVEALALYELGEMAEARELAALLIDLYPGHAALDHVEFLLRQSR
jgi:tetratricopeptide (TPR) repeat protein